MCVPVLQESVGEFVERDDGPRQPAHDYGHRRPGTPRGPFDDACSKSYDVLHGGAGHPVGLPVHFWEEEGCGKA